MLPKARAGSLLGLLLLAPGFAQAQSWLETRIQVEELGRAGDFAAAEELGDELLDRVTAALGDTSVPLAEAHLLLAHISTARAFHLAAEGHVLDAIDILERLDGPQSTTLIEPFVVLGDTYRAAGEFELALGSYQEARNIGRRAYGLFNSTQIPIIDQMSITRLRMGELDEAKKLQQEAITLAQRQYGEDSVEFLDANYRYAEWLRSLRLHADAERHYFSMHRQINREFDGDPIQTIRLLRTQASNQREATANPRFVGFNGAAIAGLTGTAPQDLERALKIAEKLDVPDPILQASILRDIGDWNLAYGRTDEIAEPYLEAWHLLEGVEGGEELQREWFEDQTFVYVAPIFSRIIVANRAAPRGRVNLEFTIDARGRAGDVQIIGSVPAGLMDDAAAQQIMASRFRPRIKDGEIVESSGIFTWEFQYDPQRALRFSSTFDEFTVRPAR